ncbi:MAG: DUF4176 domain-containing protein [Eubacterium sp.]
MNKIDWLSPGSVVNVRTSHKKFMIVSRGVMIHDDIKGNLYFDYGGCLYPEGVVNDQIMYFNHEDIDKVLFEGYSNEYDRRLKKNLSTWMENADVKKGKLEDTAE